MWVMSVSNITDLVRWCISYRHCSFRASHYVPGLRSFVMFRVTLSELKCSPGVGCVQHRCVVVDRSHNPYIRQYIYSVHQSWVWYHNSVYHRYCIYCTGGWRQAHYRGSIFAVYVDSFPVPQPYRINILCYELNQPTNQPQSHLSL